MNLSEDPYAAADLYRLEISGYDEDLAFYRRILSQTRRPVLELGCGTGRLTLPLARDGHEIHALDRSPAMLAALEEALESEAPETRARVWPRLGDFRSLGTQGHYEIVLWPFNAIHHCTNEDEVLEVLKGVRSNLAPQGRLVLDSYLPDASLFDPTYTSMEDRSFFDEDTFQVIESWERSQWDDEQAVLTTTTTYRWPDGRSRQLVFHLRMFALDRLHALVDQAGFDVHWEAEDFEGTPTTATSLKWVAVLISRK